MKERPILFSAPMVRALLDGRKTQTRRVVTTREPLQFIGGRGEESDPAKWGWFFDGPDHSGYMVLGRGLDERFEHGCTSIPCPYGEPSDRLWCKETWWTAKSFDDKPPRRIAEMALDAGYSRPWGPVRYADATDNGLIADFGREWGKVRPSIFMPRWASRITLEVTDVRVQRLQEITDEDAKAEGVEPYTPPHGHISPEQRVPGPGFECCRLGDQPHRLPFADLWDHINGDRAPWTSNPWIWAITFQRLP